MFITNPVENLKSSSIRKATTWCAQEVRTTLAQLKNKTLTLFGMHHSASNIKIPYVFAIVVKENEKQNEKKAAVGAPQNIKTKSHRPYKND